jgi:hypothetical protein
MNSKAQTAFEMVFVTGIIFIFLLIAYANYFFPAETFNVSAEAKLEAVNVLNQYALGQTSIKEIELKATETEYTINIITSPSSITWQTISEAEAKEKIKDKISRFTQKDIIITFNT